MMEKVIAFRSMSGKLFETEEEALKSNRVFVIDGFLTDHPQYTVPRQGTNVKRLIADNWDEFKKIMNEN